MSCLKTGTAASQQTDPTKRPNYTFGMVLGADELTQEHVYLHEKHKLHNRALHGYGTVSGLKLEIAAGPEIRVSPGLAVNPAGEEICVGVEMCAQINDWLTAKRKSLEKLYPTPVFPLDLSLAVALCARECETDLVPVPGEPCRTQQDKMQASRIQDSFEIMLVMNEDRALHLSPPNSPASMDGLQLYRPCQREEDAVRLFGGLLDRIEIGSEHPETPGELVDLVRRLRMAYPDLGHDPIYLDAATACERIHEAFRVWVTEVRPRLSGDKGKACEEPREKCVLLGVVNLRVNAAWQVTGEITIDESLRPLLMHTRLLQEWILCRRMCHSREQRTFANACVQNAHTVRVWFHHPALLHVPADSVRVDVLPPNVAEFTVTPAISQPGPNLNVFDLTIQPDEVAPGSGVRVRFLAADVYELDSPSRSLADVLAGGAWEYVDFIEGELHVWASRCDPAHNHDQYALKDHNHDDKYAPKVHNHDDRYPLKNHNHDDRYPLKNHNHDDRYAPKDHDHDDRYAPKDHDHDDRYALKDHTHDFTKQFVQIPKTAENTYFIVAAGYWRFGPEQQEGVVLKPFNNFSNFNDTTATVADRPGEFLINFTGYKPVSSQSRFLYVVKGTVLEERPDPKRTMVFEFVAFDDRGIRVRLHRFGDAIPERLGFMVEVSRIGGKE